MLREDDEQPGEDAGGSGPGQVSQHQPLAVGEEQHHGDRGISVRLIVAINAERRMIVMLL